MTEVALRFAQGLGEAIGRSVCARTPGHGLWPSTPPAVLCARCAAMHVALTATVLLHLATSSTAARRPGFASALGLVLLCPLAVDVALIRSGVSAGSMLARVTTGALAGSGLGLLLAAAGGPASRHHPGRGSRQLPLVMVAGALAGLAVALLPPEAAGALSGIAAVAVIFNLGAALTTMIRGLRARPRTSDWMLGALAAGALVAVLSWRP